MTGCTGDVKQDAMGKWIKPCVLCPAHLGWHAKALQARDACVPVGELQSPVFSTVARFEKVPAGATVVVAKEELDDVTEKVGKLVLVITREQEEQGYMYDASLPFELNGRKFRPTPRGVWFAVPGKGYAAHAWASAAGVTHRIRKLMRKANARSGEETVPEAVIEKLSSRSLRIGMATLLKNRDVPIEEIVENGGWEDAAMCKTYIRSLAPLAVEQRNLSDVMFPLRRAAEADGRAEAVGDNGVGATPVLATVLAAPALGMVATPPANDAVAQELRGLRGILEQVLSAPPAAATSQAAGQEGAAPLVAALPAAQIQNGGGNGGALETATLARAVRPPASGAAKKRKVREDPREQPCCPSLWVKGKVFKRNNIAADTRLRELLEATASRDLKTTQSALCPAGYHVTQKEIKNYRYRKTQQTMPPVDVAPGALLSAIAEAAGVDQVA